MIWRSKLWRSMVERFKHCCSSIPLYPVTVRVGGPKLDVAAGVDDDGSPGDVSHNGGFLDKKHEAPARNQGGRGWRRESREGAVDESGGGACRTDEEKPIPAVRGFH